MKKDRKTTHASAELPLTPRHAYANYQAANFRAKAKLLMALDATAMKNIRGEFQKRGWKLEIGTFIQAVEANSRRNSSMKSEQWAMHQEALCDIFREIDVNHDGDLTWQELTNFLVEVASAASDTQSLGSDVYSYMKHAEDKTAHDYALNSVYWFAELDQLVILEGRGSWFKVYSSELQLIKTIRAHRAPIFAMAYSEKMQAVLSCSQDNTVKFWSKGSFLLIHTVRLEHPQVALTCAGNCMYTADVSGDILQLSMEHGELRRRLAGHTDSVMAFCVLPGRDELASASLDCTVRVWSFADGECLTALTGHKKGVLCVAYEARLDLLVSGGFDPFVLVFDLASLHRHASDEALHTTASPHAPPPRASQPATGKKKGAHAVRVGVPEKYLTPFSAKAKAGVCTTGLKFTTADDVLQVKMVACNSKGEFIVFDPLHWSVLQRFSVAREAAAPHALTDPIHGFIVVPPKRLRLSSEQELGVLGEDDHQDEDEDSHGR